MLVSSPCGNPARFTIATAPSPLPALAAARDGHERLFAGLIAADERCTVEIISPPGTGKTEGLARAVKWLAAAGWPEVPVRGGGTRPLRLLYLGPTVELAQQFIAATDGAARLVLGRQDDPTHPFGCENWAALVLFRSARQGLGSACNACLAQHQATHGPDWLCNYLNSRWRIGNAPVVAAPIQCFLNDTGAVAAFDVVVVDEALLPSLLEPVTLTERDLATWTARMDELMHNDLGQGHPSTWGPDSGWRHLFSALVAVLRHPDRPKSGGYGWRPALPLLREVCYDLAALIAGLAAEVSDQNRLPFEAAAPDDVEAPPLRLAADLLAAIAVELDRPTGADTRLWLAPDGLILYRLRARLVELLSRMTLVNLDATPNPLLRRLVPNLVEVGYEVPIHVHVTQVTDNLCARRLLAHASKGEGLRRRVRAVIAAWGREATKPVVLSHKAVDPQ